MKRWQNLTDTVGLTNYGDVESAKNAIKQNQAPTVPAQVNIMII